jgi:hypothetical protein
MKFPPTTRGTFQRTFEDYSLDLGVPGDFVTITRDPFGSKVHLSESPGSTPRTSTTVDGTVVRNDADRSIDFTNLDSIVLTTVLPGRRKAKLRVYLGQQVGRHVGSNLKYYRSVGQHVGRPMTDLPPKVAARQVRALEMLCGDVRIGKVLGSDGDYVVPSQAGKGYYRVHVPNDPNAAETCSCPDFEERRAACKHIFLVRLDQEAERAPPPSYGAGGLTPLNPPKRNWTLYNRGQMEEGRLVKRLLRDLANGFPEPYKDPRLAGRKPVPLRDQAFCSVLRSYYGFSLRRSHDFRQIAVEKELLSSPHSYSLVSHFLNRPDVADGLHEMLARSAIPLIALEDSCAIDSTGLRTSQFNYYRKEKYEPARENVWLKLHALVGVKTHAIPVLEVTAGSVSDCPQFPILLKRAEANGFQFKEVYADKAYQSRENFNTAAELDVLPFIPFKKSQTGVSKGSPLYHKMFLFFQYKREEFDRHYGQRAQVESTFGALKQKLSETLVSRKFTSQQNEILCLAIAHNIMVLVRQMFEADILPDFLQPPAVTPVNSPVTANPRPSLFLNRVEPGLAVPQSAALE